MVRMDTHLKRLTLITNNELALLSVGGINDMDDLGYLKYTAPLIFWCYCLQFVVNCMNHSSVKSLDWKTPMEKLHGKTPDISMFRFGLWAPVW